MIDIHFQIGRPEGMERAYWFHGVTHAREWLSPATLLKVMDRVRYRVMLENAQSKNQSLNLITENLIVMFSNIDYTSRVLSKGKLNNSLLYSCLWAMAHTSRNINDVAIIII